MQEIVTLGGGASYTIIRARGTFHTLKVYQDGTRNTAFEYKRKNDGTTDGFTVVFTTQAGDPITLVGHGRSGIIGRPPNYNGYNALLGYNEPQDAAASASDTGGGDIVLYIKAADDSTPDVTLVWSENEF